MINLYVIFTHIASFDCLYVSLKLIPVLNTGTKLRCLLNFGKSNLHVKSYIFLVISLLEFGAVFYTL